MLLKGKRKQVSGPLATSRIGLPMGRAEKLRRNYASWAREFRVRANKMISGRVPFGPQARLTPLANPYNLRDGKGLRARFRCGGVYKKGLVSPQRVPLILLLLR